MGIHYLIQAGEGQLELSNRARPISEVLKDERVLPRTRELLADIPDVKHFAESYGIKPTSNYTDYVKLDRSAAVYVVSACEPLAFEPRRWSFPLVGSFTYVGWFHLDDAKNYADELRKEGLDVNVRGAQAYSTLGWFRDAILSTMIPDTKEALGDLVNTVIHESVHATIYVKNQSTFNESLASFVADRLTPVYLRGKAGPHSPELESYLDGEKEGERREKLLHEAYVKLAALYASNLPAEEKLKRKGDLLAQLKKELGITREINNATLIQYQTYREGLPEFQAVLESCGSDWRRFLKALEPIQSSSFPRAQEDAIGSTILKFRCAGSA